MISEEKMRDVEDVLYRAIFLCAEARKGKKDSKQYAILAETEAMLHNLTRRFSGKKAH